MCPMHLHVSSECSAKSIDAGERKTTEPTAACRRRMPSPRAPLTSTPSPSPTEPCLPVTKNLELLLPGGVSCPCTEGSNAKGAVEKLELNCSRCRKDSSSFVHAEEKDRAFLDTDDRSEQWRR